MTRVRFENATIRDVVGKASRVAPTSGSNFEKSAGIKLEVTDQRVVVRATNTEVFYMELTDVVEIEGPPVTWLLPSVVLDGICSKLSIKSGSFVDFDDKLGAQVSIKSGRMSAKLRMMNHEYYPKWNPFDATYLTPVADFAGRIQQVQWAASKTAAPPITGVNISGTHIGASDGYRLARTPCVTSLVEPVTIPASIFGPLMKNLGEVRIGQEEGQLLIMPDDYTQIRAVIFAGKYPPLDRAFERVANLTHAITFYRDQLLEVVERALVMGVRDRSPMLKMILGHEELAVMMEDQEIGLLGDVLDIPGQAQHDRFYIGFTPENLTGALKAAPNNQVTMSYVLGKAMQPVLIDGGSGYEAIVVPRNLNVTAEAE